MQAKRENNEDTWYLPMFCRQPSLGKIQSARQACDLAQKNAGEEEKDEMIGSNKMRGHIRVTISCFAYQTIFVYELSYLACSMLAFLLVVSR